MEKIKIYSSFDIDQEEIKTGTLTSWVKYSNHKKAITQARKDGMEEAAKIAETRVSKIVGVGFKTISGGVKVGTKKQFMEAKEIAQAIRQAKEKV